MLPFDWHGLIGNFAVVAFVVIAWTMFQDATADASRRRRSILLGTIMGAGTIVAMAFAVPLAPGIFFDLRASLLALSALFGGPLAGVISAVIAAATRGYLGGAGVWTGFAAIALSSMLGIGAQFVIERKTLRYWHLAAFGAMVGAGNLATVLLLPASLRAAVLDTVALPSFLLTFIGTTAGGVVLLHEQRRRQIARSNIVYRAIIEALPDCLNVKDMSGRFIAANPATARLMRTQAADDLIGKTDFDFYPADIARELERDERTALAAAAPTVIEQHVSFPDGTAAWLSTLKTPLRNSSGETTGLVTHNRDITERRQLQDSLDLAQRHLDEALTHMADGLAMFDANGILRLCNAQYRATFPMTADIRVVGSSFEDILRASAARGEQTAFTGTLDEWVERMRQASAIEGDRQIHLDDDRTIEVRTRPLDDGGSLVVTTDITDRKRNEAILGASEARYRLLAENVGDLIVRLGTDGRCRFASPACRDLLGYQQEQMLGRHGLGVVHIQDRPAAALAFQKAMRGGKVDGLEFRAVRIDGAIGWVEVNARPVENGGGIILSMRDISQRKKTEEDLAAAVRQLEEIAATDGLTGLATRRMFDQTLGREFARCAREGTALSLFLVDVDRFKAYNDTYGHPAGDDCLRFLSQALMATLRRPADLGARYGGEEFVAILPNTNGEGALSLAEEYRAAVRQLGLTHAGSEHGIVTVSIGVASVLPGSGMTDIRDLLREADRALYTAKGGGRNAVVQAIAA